MAQNQSSRTPLIASLISGVLLWAAFPPLDLPWLAWVAPLPWLWLAKRPAPLSRWAYFAIWVGALGHWLLMLQGIRLAHVALYAGWIALAAYVAVYVPLFVGLTRVAVRRAGWPLVIAAPVIWTGLELAKGHLITGFSMGLLGHTQANFPLLLQPADFAGAYAVSFLVMLVAAALAECLFAFRPELVAESVATSKPNSRRPPTARRPYAALATGALMLLLTLLYSRYRLTEVKPDETKRSLRVALIQGSLDTVLDTSYEEQQQRVERTFEDYHRLTRQAIQSHPDVQLVLWPESMFASYERMGIDLATAPPGFDQSVETLRNYLRKDQQAFEGRVSDTIAILRGDEAQVTGRAISFLCGSTTIDHSLASMRVYNSALLFDEEGRIVDRYYKMHPVMFGEYVPFGEAFPWIYNLVPIGGIATGDGPRNFDVAGLRLCPSICFENTVPHLIRSHVADLLEKGKSPDLLVNDSNDGWFKGSGMLDLHLRCAVFRSIENRKPMLIAANTGISAWIDGNGVIREQGPRRQERVLVVEARPDGRRSLYTQFGDVPAGICLVISLGFAGFGLWDRRAANAKKPRGE